MRVYRNDGEALHFYSASQAIAIYDKRRELAKSRVSERGLLEKDNYCQFTLFDNVRSKKPFEVVRIEVRYNTKRAFNIAPKHALEYGRASDSVARLATKQKFVSKTQETRSETVGSLRYVDEQKYYHGTL